jgi:hypothetical protein
MKIPPDRHARWVSRLRKFVNLSVFKNFIKFGKKNNFKVQNSKISKISKFQKFQKIAKFQKFQKKLKIFI